MLVGKFLSIVAIAAVRITTLRRIAAVSGLMLIVELGHELFTKDLSSLGSLSH